MAISTTFWDIRDNYIAKITQLLPRLLSNVKFDLCPVTYELRQFAKVAGSGAMRRFQFDRGPGLVIDAPFFDWQVKETNEHITLTVAYPNQLAMYGRDDGNELDRVIRSDAAQLRDLLFNASNYLLGQSAAFVDIQEPDMGDDRVTYQTFDIELIYYEDQFFTISNEEKYRRLILEQFYGPTRTFVPIVPALVETGFTPAYPYLSYNVLSTNLLRIDKLTFQVDTDITVYAYHYVNRINTEYLAICHEGHSYFDLPNHAYHIQRLLNLGWNVVLVQMPQIFTVPSPPAAPQPAGMVDHGTFGFSREATDPGYLRTFLAPARNAKEYLKSTYGYSQFAMMGISGGGWSTTWLGALDTEIKASICVAGSAPFADPALWPNPGYDYEQIARTFAVTGGSSPRPAYGFLPLDNRDLYAMMADNNRLARLVYIENEAYFPSAGKHAIIDAYTAAADARVDGSVVVGYDTTQSTHEISNFTGDLIVSDLLSRSLIATGPSTTVTPADPAFTNLIAWYRGDGMSVGSMTDRSGNGNHAIQATGANQATLVTDPYLGQPCLRFDSAGPDFYKCDAVKVGGVNPIAYTEYTMVGVYKTNSPVANYMIMDATTAGGVVRTGPFMYSLSSNNGRAAFGIAADVVGELSGNQEWIWVVGVHTAASRKIYISGVLAGTLVSADSSLAITRLGIGRSIDPAPFWSLNGSIAELVFTGHAMTAPEIASLGTYINGRYGL